MTDIDESKGVIWCPHCDIVLHWEQNADGDKEITEDDFMHLKYAHGRLLKTRILTEPPAVSTVGFTVASELLKRSHD